MICTMHQQKSTTVPPSHWITNHLGTIGDQSPVRGPKPSCSDFAVVYWDLMSPLAALAAVGWGRPGLVPGVTAGLLCTL